MTAAPLHFMGERLLLDPLGAVVWPMAGLLAVADLHLEKGSACAARGQLVPPWDTRMTLDRLALLMRRWQPRIVVALGDSFHDARGSLRMAPGDAARLRSLTAAAQFVWVLGNHDPTPPQRAWRYRRRRVDVGSAGVPVPGPARRGRRAMRPPPSQGQRHHPRRDGDPALLRGRCEAFDAAGYGHLYRRARRGAAGDRRIVPARRPGLPVGAGPAVQLHSALTAAQTAMGARPAQEPGRRSGG